MCEMASLEAEDPWILYFICLFIVLSMQAVNVGLEERIMDISSACILEENLR